MTRILPPCFFCILICISASAQQKQDHSILQDVDREKLVSRADLTYSKPVSKSEEGMPVGNGVMGSLVWTTPSALHFQLNRVDVFANNSASDNFYERHTDYCGGVGFVDIEMIDDSREVFTGDTYRQHLACYDGLTTIDGKGVTAAVTAWQEQDVMAIRITDTRSSPLPIQTHLRALRLPITRRGDHQAISVVNVTGNRIVLTQTFREGDFYCGSAVVVEMTGREGRAGVDNTSMVTLLATVGNTDLTILMASAASFDPAEDLVAAACRKLDAAKAIGFDGIRKSNRQWWQRFWKKSFIHLHSADLEADTVELHYTYYLYVMASSSRGKYPVKFNGMLWTTGGDERKWGNLYWGANQSCLYNALLQTNHLELMDPMFNMYSTAFNTFQTAARQQWGSKGIYIPETVAFDGLAPLPDDIAAEMRDLYLMKKPWTERSQKFTGFAYTKMPFLSRWNWKKDEGWKNGTWHTSDKGGGPFGHVTHIFSRGAKIAFQYWLKYEHTQDTAWLRREAYPMLKGVAEFYRNFPHVKKENDGKYHIYDINDNESVWGGHNTVEEIASMHGILPVAIRASEILKVDADLRTSWREFLDNLSPLTTNTDLTGYKAGTPVTWVRSLPPIIQGNGAALPDPNTMPVWFFDLCTLEADQKTLSIANQTYDAYFPAGISEKSTIHVLSKLPVAGAALGRVVATCYLLPNQIHTTEVPVMTNRMDTREGVQTTSVQRLGRAAEALHYALCQSVPPAPGKDPVIHIFPAWPPTWDAHFTLLTRGAFLVTSSFTKKSGIEFIEVDAQAGGTCRIRNPWKNTDVTIYRNGKRLTTTNKDLITFSTQRHDHFIILKKGATPNQYHQKIL